MSSALLVDVDSKITNLALSRVSTFEKVRGHDVSLYRHRRKRTGPNPLRRTLPVDLEQCDRAYVSCIFTWNRAVGEGIVRALESRGAVVLRGGTGFDWGKPASERAYLPPEIEHAPPDYDLYGNDYALEFCLRGCNRSCTFCDVPKSEGKITLAGFRPPWTWVPEGFRKAMLLDNDMAFYPDSLLAEILEWFPSAGVRYSMTQGWDLRLTTEARAKLLYDTHPWDNEFQERTIYCAWDYLGIEPHVRKGIGLLLDAGFKGQNIVCYMIVGHDSKTRGPTPIGESRERASALHRFHVLRDELGVFPYVMPFNNRHDDPWITAFARYVNRRRVWRSGVEWEDYRWDRRRTMVKREVET